jgi:RNA polymerase sigma factor (sigma-70 family)
MTKTEEFSELLRTYGDMAYRMALHLTGGREDEARDLVQEAFVRIWRYWSIQKPDHFKSWMYRILHNLYMDDRRRARRRPTVSLDEPLSDSEEAGTWDDHLAENSPDPFGQSEIHELQAHVAAALRRLPPEFRIPIALCDMDGLSYDEIARIVSCPVGTVRSRIHRGRMQLRRTLVHLRNARWAPAKENDHRDL